MIGELTYSTKWWAWWSNPLIGISPDQRRLLPLLDSTMENPNYSTLLELRELLRLDDLPDEKLYEQLNIRALCLASPTEMNNHLSKLAVLSMNSDILNARPQDWEDHYGIRSAEQIRDVITEFNNLSHLLLPVQISLTASLRKYRIAPLPIHERIRLITGLYLINFFPKLFHRWKLMLSLEIANLIEQMPKLPVDVEENLSTWFSHSLTALHSAVFEQFDVPLFDFDEDEFDVDEEDPEPYSSEGQAHA